MQNAFPVNHSPHVCNKTYRFVLLSHAIDMTWLTGLGLGLVVFGLGLMTEFWSWSRSRSRSRTLWSRSWPWSHYVLVSLTSLVLLQRSYFAGVRTSSTICSTFIFFLKTTTDSASTTWRSSFRASRTSTASPTRLSTCCSVPASSEAHGSYTNSRSVVI